MAKFFKGTNYYTSYTNYFASASDGPALLSEFDFRTPSTSWATGRTGFSSAYATDEWLLQETSGTYANNVGTATLSNSGGYQGQEAVGLFDGTNYTNRKAWEGFDKNDYLLCSDVSVGDPNGSDFCLRVVFRIESAQTDAYIASKRDLGTGIPGWSLNVNSAGVPVFTIDDGPNSGSRGLLTSVKDGAWHYITAWFDESTGSIYVKSDLDSELSAASSVSSPSSTNAITVNNLLVGTGSKLHQQLAYIGVCVGSNAKSMYDEVFWNHATDPTGLVSTINRPSLISLQVDDTHVTHFASDTLPISYNSGLEAGVGGYGLFNNNAHTNLLYQSESLTPAGAWNDFNTTRLDNVSTAPDGFINAGSVTATANNGAIYDQIGSIDSKKYTFSCWVKRNGSSDVTGAIKQYDTANANFFATQTFTATDTWQLVSCTGTMGTGTSGLRHYCYVDNSGDSILFWGMQHNTGSVRGPYVRTSGTSTSLVKSIYTSDSTAGTLVHANKGEVEIVSIESAVGENNLGHRFWAEMGSSGNTNKRTFVSASNAIVTNVGLWAYNSSGGLEANITILSPPNTIQENTGVWRWDDSGGLAKGGGEDFTVSLNGAADITDVGTYTSSETITRIRLGSGLTGANQGNNWISRLRIWESER